MQPSILTYDEIEKHYTSAMDELYEIAWTYYTLGRSGTAQQLLRTSLDLLEVREQGQQERLKLLLLYGQVLIVDHALTHKSTDLMFSTILQARQIAETTQNQEGIADALSLLGQAHYWETMATNLEIVTASLRGEPLPEGFRERFNEALAYQQQALELREEVHDTRGMSESLFQIGSIYERWQQYEKAQEQYMKALQIADQYGHLFEKTEPTRHLALHALIRGDLDQALTYGLQALSLREAARFRPYLPLDHLLLRNIYLAKGDTKNALHHTQKASDLAEEMGYTRLVSTIVGSGDVQEVQKEGA